MPPTSGAPGKRGSFVVPRPEEVEEASDGRVEAGVHRAHAAAEATQLVEDRPGDRLLERDGAEGPGADVREARIVRRERHPEGPAAGEEEDVLRPVEDQHDGRIRIHLRGPGPAHEPHPLGEGRREQAFGRVGRKVGLDVAHREPSGWLPITPRASRSPSSSWERPRMPQSTASLCCPSVGAGVRNQRWMLP